MFRNVVRRLRIAADIIGPDAVLADGYTGHKRHPGRHTDRGIADTSAEGDALGCQPIEVGADYHGVARKAHCIAALLIGKDEEDVGLPSHPDSWFGFREF